MTLRAAHEASRRLDQPYLPNLNGHISGALANPNARLAAGQMTNPFVISRFGMGITFSQVLWDGGRGLHLRASERQAAEAARQAARQSESEAVFQAEQAFWRLWELTQNASGSSPEVAIAQADLCQAMGRVRCPAYRPAVLDPAAPGLEGNSETWVDRALERHPELLRLRALAASAEETARIDSGYRPTLSLLGAAGLAPFHRNINFADKYAIGAFNWTFPVLSTDRQVDHSALRGAASHEHRAAEVRVAHRTRVAWIEADAAWNKWKANPGPALEAAFRVALARLRFESGFGTAD
jgi:hypothetical protein